MKILFIGDPHLKVTRFELAKEFLAWVNTVVIAEKPDLVVNLGDTFDTHAVIRSEVLTEFMNHVADIQKTCPNYIYLLGNHDMWKPTDSTYHAMRHLKGKIPGFTIVDEVLNDDKLGITFVPYVHNPENFPIDTLQICVAHQTFKGADYGDITTKDGVDADKISADVIISGHIHKKQVLGKVIYPGSPFSQSVSDINQVKGLLLFDTATLKEKFIESPMPKWKGIKFELSQSFSLEDMHSELADVLKNTKDHWVVEITGPKSEITSYLSSKKAASLFKDIDIKIKTNFTDKEKKLTKINSLSIGSIMRDYIDKVYSGALDKDKLHSKSMDLLNKIRQ